MENLNVTLVQPNTIWEEPLSNLSKYTRLVREVSNADLIVFPETFTTGFSMNSKKFSEKMNGASVEWMKKLAAEKSSCIVGSLIIEEAGKIYNRAVWVFPDGRLEYYDKRHLFTMGEEDKHFSPGKEKLTIDYKGWRFQPLICYDLRFPVWARNTENYDVLIYVANWPSPRHHAWKNLLISRAIENQSYCIGVNRVGNDANGLSFLGESAVVFPKGYAEYLGETEQVKSFELSYSELHDFRKSFPVLNDRDNFRIQ